MKGTTVAGFILVVLGIQGLAYGAFNYTLRDNWSKNNAAVAATHLRQKVIIPLSLGAGGCLIGGLLLLVGGRKGFWDDMEDGGR
ncbi:MAG: hypothetical protein COW19_09340 [Zetaproteobacteria bacterium CG12_big_fil_rev_8_21_14_0_65_55_1124]|nr:MAG: hypothetical protein AUJ58_10475 [Zetaproteobacteria bacterium CG1_02_55_237]PIS18454.1 MAG: hypothetical protein COT53_10730 [Zetaproteobacteria bacterium CG08_land_8_20_14_0_20_55_17]PIW42212.1 MAG: hypothetical protein COW19_09340 [Zetaproteobacteria bacterium CG12_big_fil_rev_8_21_14_0_65_55_1124]PIY53781.1 MAG: hypothetical protein COZ01_02625 [Zetaproteobacteria bacterium CG_4_10_14_0_8_um_filter_55_43]PIZ38474.1 MAG: hypothetical protein COY36_06095 [Zetaproteobacteria bacterium 